MSNAATDWLGKGTLWRHPGTGHIAGPVLEEGPYNRDWPGRWLGRSATALIGLAYVISLVPVAQSAYRAWVHPGRFPPPIPFLPLFQAIIIGGAVALGLRATLRIAPPKARVALCLGSGLLLYQMRYSPVLVAMTAILAVLSAISARHCAKAVNARWETKGYKAVRATLKAPPPPPPPSQPVPDFLRSSGPPPAKYSGRWGNKHYMNGELIGHYEMELTEADLAQYWRTFAGNRVWIDYATTNIGKPNEHTTMHVMQLWWLYEVMWGLRKFDNPKYPYGYRWDERLYDYVPVQADPYESPTPVEFPDEPEPRVYGNNKPLDDDALTAMGALQGERTEP